MNVKFNFNFYLKVLEVAFLNPFSITLGEEGVQVPRKIVLPCEPTFYVSFEMLIKRLREHNYIKVYLNLK